MNTFLIDGNQICFNPNNQANCNGKAIIRFELDFKLKNLSSVRSITRPFEFFHSLNTVLSSVSKSELNTNIDLRNFRV